MIRLTSLLHDEELGGVLERWFLGRYDPADAAVLKRNVNLNAYLVRLYLNEFVSHVLQGTVGGPVFSFLAERKGLLKDFICRNPPLRTARIEAMLAHYRRFPEDYYRETPFEGRLYYRGSPEKPEYLCSSRSKRMRRIAEKSARRIVEYIYGEIKRRADELAADRAAHLGIPKDRLITPSEQQIEEFAHAERRLVKSIRLGTFSHEWRPELFIHDAAGVKVVTDFVPLDELRRFFASSPRLEVLEEEKHSGRYNAVNFILRYRLDKDYLLRRPPDARVTAELERRGVAAADAVGPAYRAFVESAADVVNVELIAASYEEMMESEIGRAMHETRVMEQRGKQEYRGHLARNTEYLVEYALAFAVSPTRTLPDLPLRVWVRYMPDYFDDLIKALWGIRSSASIPCSEGLDEGENGSAATAAPAGRAGSTSRTV